MLPLAMAISSKNRLPHKTQRGDISKQGARCFYCFAKRSVPNVLPAGIILCVFGHLEIVENW